jgi:hypothetical protein
MMVQGQLDFTGTGCGDRELLIPISFTSFYPPASSIDPCNEELGPSVIIGLQVELGYNLRLGHDCD